MEKAKFAIVSAALVGIAVPILAIGTLVLAPGTEWMKPLVANKELTASLATLAAASFAALGILATLQAQGHTMNANIQAQKDAVTSARIEETKRLASALQGEVNTIWNLFAEAEFEKMLESTIRALHEKQDVAAGPRVADCLDRVFRDDPSCIGWLPVPLPEWIARFYGLYANIAHDTNLAAGSIDKASREGAFPSTPEWLAQVFEGPLKDVRTMRNNVAWTIPALAATARGLALPAVPSLAEVPAGRAA